MNLSSSAKTNKHVILFMNAFGNIYCLMFLVMIKMEIKLKKEHFLILTKLILKVKL